MQGPEEGWWERKGGEKDVCFCGGARSQAHLPGERTPSSETACGDDGETRGCVRWGAVRVLWTGVCILSEVSAFTKAGVEGDVEVQRAEVLPHVRTFNTAFSCTPRSRSVSAVP